MRVKIIFTLGMLGLLSCAAGGFYFFRQSADAADAVQQRAIVWLAAQHCQRQSARIFSCHLPYAQLQPFLTQLQQADPDLGIKRLRVRKIAKGIELLLYL